MRRVVWNGTTAGGRAGGAGRRALGLAAAAAAWGALAAAGCGQPKIELTEENVRLVMRLNTAVMSKRADLLEGVLSDARATFEAGGLTEAAYSRIESIGEEGRSGRWDRAQKACLKLQKAQRAR